MAEQEPPGIPDDALTDLLVKQVTEGLSPAEQRELDVLDGPLVSETSRALERAVAAVLLAASANPAPLPELLRARLQRQAADHFSAPATGSPAAGLPPVVTPDGGAATPPPSQTQRAAAAGAILPAPAPGPARTAGAAGWWAAAACLLLAMYAWFRTPTLSSLPPSPPVAEIPAPVPPAGPVQPIPVPTPAPTSVPTPAEERAALLAQAGAVKLNLGATKDPAAAGVTGDVVWDPAKQRGFIRFSGLKPNDPTRRQYQIWVFDGERDPRYPVDGGLFDVPEGQSEIVVPIRALLPVHVAKAFAVTVEKPGGVVVSARDHVIALAQAT